MKKFLAIGQLTLVSFFSFSMQTYIKMTIYKRVE